MEDNSEEGKGEAESERRKVQDGVWLHTGGSYEEALPKHQDRPVYEEIWAKDTQENQRRLWLGPDKAGKIKEDKF